MEKRKEAVQMDEFMLPGFRFHPTDEELVGFYLTRKIQQKPLSVELIRQIDIYKYDPWDLPKLATNGEKEWYFYCPRDRKYRNSVRPNRVTGAGFWKATGTDRPIYSCQSSKCIGLKKSLVFYKGKAAKGVKTDWMMHEFRLPSVSGPVGERYLDESIPASLGEAWAICRIFKKGNSSTKRALSHSWASPIVDATISHIINPVNSVNNSNIQLGSSTRTMANKTNSPLQLGFCNDIGQSSMASFSPQCFPHIGSKPCPVPTSTGDHLNPSYAFSSVETHKTASKCDINDASALLLEMSNSIFGDFARGSANMDFSTSQEQFNDLSATAPEDMQENLGHGEEAVPEKGGQIDDQLGSIITLTEFPYSFPSSLPDAWKSNMMWDSPPCPTELSTNYSTNRCYT